MIKGTGASDGIGIGIAKVMIDKKPVFKRRRIRDTAAELEKLDSAVSSFTKATEALADKVAAEAGEKEAEILRGHIMILKDPVLRSEIEKLIKDGECAEAAVEQICNMFISVFSARNDELTRQRAADMEDLKGRLIRHLLGISEISLSSLPPDTVVCIRELTPSMTAGLDKEHIAGFVTEKGGETSHCAILARALGIPAVLGAEGITEEAVSGDRIILDGDSGIVICRPDDETTEKYREKKQLYDKSRELLMSYRGKPTVDADGRPYCVLCNIGTPADADKAIDGDSEGIGLLRTEFIFLDRTTEPSEEEQLEAYRSAALKMKGKPLVIRTFDIGGDKAVPYLEMDEEENPFLGVRAVRYCMAHPETAERQLRAMLRASAYGNIKILIPMISDIDELRFVRTMLHRIQHEFDETGIPYDKDIKLGVMIETPSACIIADMLAKEADFFSIGTNDLIQYTMAADRGNSDVGYLYSVFKPSVLRAIKHTIRCAAEAGITVEMCGEAAANPLMTPLLISYGLEKFSVSPSSVLRIRAEISRYTKQRADELAAAVETMSTSDEICAYLREQTVDRQNNCFY